MNKGVFFHLNVYSVISWNSSHLQVLVLYFSCLSHLAHNSTFGHDLNQIIDN